MRMVSLCLAYIQRPEAGRSDTYKTLGAVGAELHLSSTNVFPSSTVQVCKVLKRRIEVGKSQGRFFDVEVEEAGGNGAAPTFLTPV